MNNPPVRLVVDSSVAVKWFISEGEDGVAVARHLLESHQVGAVRLCSPSLVLLEVLNVLRTRGLDAVDMDAAAGQLIDARLDLSPVEALAQRAAVVAATHDLTVYDAAFVALAGQLDAELVTADRRLAECGACRTRLL